MEARGLRYFVGFVVVIGLLILLIVLIFGGGDNKKVPQTTRTLSSYAAGNSQVSMTIDGKENSASEHRQVVIAVNPDRVLYEVKQGYNGSVIESHQFTNTTSAYTAFLLALEHANFNKVDTKHLDVDPRGYCPLGQRFIFELTDNGNKVSRDWWTTCNKPKTFLGDANTVITLFQAQVPGYHTLIDNVDF
ncbi:MAG: hypothetical protein JWO41_88 [Candidatus Saccharibacteria bacterium]|nr:hypothetical protein [Candidatus Saccharibacteria bacterium]